MKKTIGILGGMGPEATAFYFELIIRNTRAVMDQDHIPVIIWSNPKIPPRTDAILKAGPSPLPLLQDGIKRLAGAGADFIVMPCLTAHYFIDDLRAASPVPVISLLEETLSYALKHFPELKTTGLIATTGTVSSKLFHKAFSLAGIKVLTPSAAEQQQVMEAIFGKEGVKAGFVSGYPKETVLGIAHHLIDRGAEAVVAGCTEVPLILFEEEIPAILLDPMRIGARSCIIKAGYRLNNNRGSRKDQIPAAAKSSMSDPREFTSGSKIEVLGDKKG